MEPLEDRAVPALDLSGLTVTPLVVAPGDVVAVGGTIADDRPMDYAGVTAYWGDGSLADSTLIPADPPVSSLSVDGYLSHSFSAVGTYTVTIQVDADIPPDGDSDSDSATFTVTVLPGVSVAVLNDAAEYWTDGVLRFTRTGGTGTALSATYSVSGSATAGTDYTALSGSVAFAAGSSTADVPIHALRDTLAEDDETVIATITGDGTTYTGVGNEITLTIYDTTVLPVAVGFSNNTEENTPSTVTPLDAVYNPDGDALTLSAVGGAGHGTVAVNADGSVTYTPDTGYVGDDSFTYTVAYATGTTTATISYTVDGLMAPPFSAWTAPGAEVDIDAAGVSCDPTGGTPTVSAVGSAGHGLVAINADGTIGYTPDSGFTGDDSFSYTVEDAAGNQRSNTITVTVAASAPVALDADATTDQDTAVTVSVLDSAFNPAGGTLSVASVTQGAHGTAAVNADGTVTYTPAAGYAGPDSFDYTVTDGNGNTATGAVNLTVGPPPAGPTDQIDSDLAGIQTDLENADDNTPATVSSIWSASVSGALNAYLNDTTQFISTANTLRDSGNLSFGSFFEPLYREYKVQSYHSLNGAYQLLSGVEQAMKDVVLANKQLTDQIWDAWIAALKAKDFATAKTLIQAHRTLRTLQFSLIDTYLAVMRLNRELFLNTAETYKALKTALKDSGLSDASIQLFLWDPPTPPDPLLITPAYIKSLYPK